MSAPARVGRAAREPRGHWIVAMLVLVVIGAALLANGYVRGDSDGTGSGALERSPRAGLTAAGAVLDLSGDALTSSSTPANAIALTFDDGPDRRWTPEILDVLAAHDVDATFFVLGEAVLDEPRLTRAIRDSGSELGVHTLTHADITRLADWELDLELSLTQTALAGAVGVRPTMFRPPFSSTVEELTVDELAASRRVAEHGYLIALSDYDSNDWRRPGVDAIVADATPPPGRGGVVLFHDGGGDRAQTVAALDRYIPLMKSKGYRFVTLSEYIDVPVGSLAPEAGTVQNLQGRGLRLVYLTGGTLAGIGALLLPLLGVLALVRTVFLVVVARRHAQRAARLEWDPVFTPHVTIVVPAYNEAAGIASSLTSFANGDYPDLDVVLVDDGSTDETAAIARSLGLANVRVITQRNTGKPGALNAGIAAARGDIIVMVDGDTVFERDTVRCLVQRFKDPSVGAISGNTKVANRRGILGKWQHIEYVMGFNLDRRMYELARCMPTVPGAIGAFRRAALVEIGGVSNDTLAEDTDLTMAINRRGWHVVYEERARAWTEAPATLRQLWKQRYRWSYGTMQAMWKHRGSLRPSERSSLGRRALPYMLLFQVLLPMLAPLIDVFALYGILFLDRGPVVGFWLGFTLLQLLIAAYAFRLDGERLRPLWTMPLQQLVYRQLMYLVVLHSVITALIGAPLRWHKLDRSGDFSGVPDTANDAPTLVSSSMR